MVDAVAVLPPAFRILDSTGAPASGAQIRFFDAGTSTPKTVYSDSTLATSLGSIVYTRSDGLPVASQGSSTTVLIYTGIAAYKIDVLDSTGATLIPSKDNVKGAVDTSTFLTTGSTSTLDIAVVAKTANYTLVAADNGKLINANPSGGNFTLTFTAAATLTDGWNIFIRNASTTTGQVLLSSSETIAFEGGSFTARALEIGEALFIVCDGTAFKVASYTPPLMASRAPGVIVITDRVAAAPGAPTPGARYIATAIFTTGAITTAVGDIIEANGTSFNKYVPATDCGWLAYVQDEDEYYFFAATAWQLLRRAASDTVAGIQENAVQSEMETGTSTTLNVTPGRQHFHIGHPKAGGNFDGSGTPAFRAGDYGMGAITDGGTGVYTLALDTAFADTTYWLTAWSREAAVGSDASVVSAFAAYTKTASAMQVGTFNPETNALHDSTESGVMFWGDYA